MDRYEVFSQHSCHPWVFPRMFYFVLCFVCRCVVVCVLFWEMRSSLQTSSFHCGSWRTLSFSLAKRSVTLAWCLQAKASLKQINECIIYFFFILFLFFLFTSSRCVLCHFFNLLVFSVPPPRRPLSAASSLVSKSASGLLFRWWWTWRATTVPPRPSTSRCWAAPCAPTATSWTAWRSSRTSPSPSTATPWAPWTSTTTSPPAMAPKVPLC